MFTKATKAKQKLRLALVGPSGSGKTYTALTMARTLAGDGGIAVIDTERGSASLYAGSVADFDVVNLGTFEPLRFVETIEAAANAGYPVLVIDSLSHAWSGTGGALDQVDRRASGSLGKFGAWRDVTPQHNALVDAILGYPGHVIATMRAKTEYVVEEDAKGKQSVTKLGLAPVQRNGVEYEFTVVGDIDHAHTMTVTKSRCAALADQVIRKPGAKVAERLLAWLEDGEERPADQALALIAAGKVEKAREVANKHKATMRKDEKRRLRDAFARAPDVAPSHEEYMERRLAEVDAREDTADDDPHDPPDAGMCHTADEDAGAYAEAAQQ